MKDSTKDPAGAASAKESTKASPARPSTRQKVSSTRPSLLSRAHRQNVSANSAKYSASSAVTQVESSRHEGQAGGEAPSSHSSEINVGNTSETLRAKVEEVQRRKQSVVAVSEQSVMSPSLEEAFSSPSVSGMHTSSTESAESAKTVRATPAMTPGHQALRTPSYPFPRMVSSSSTQWSGPTHQPFTALSPTVPAADSKPLGKHRDKWLANPDTPGSNVDFEPSDSGETRYAENKEFPMPKLYDLVLQLNSEPSLESWWTVLTTSLHEWYKVDRAVLSLPTDSTDLENMPWGQKASYDAAGLKAFSLPSETASTTSGKSKSSSSKKSVQSERPVVVKNQFLARPQVETRHSYAGHEANVSAATNDVLKPSPAVRRPGFSRRTTTHAPHTEREPATSSKASTPFTGSSRSELPEFTMRSKNIYEVPDIKPMVQSFPRSAVFESLHSLSHEVDALLDTKSVNDILERSRPVTLTREYANSDRNSSSSRSERSADMASSAVQPTTYDEYEQFPPSPWAQSPAPSPAIQTGKEVNPFFVDEDSFNPTPTNENFGQDRVPAIGVDHASTVIHIPLIHPLASKMLQPLHENERGRPSKYRHKATREARKAPIAILSILSRFTPYPPELLDSLRKLTPHLATSFHTSHQLSSIQTEVGRLVSKSGNSLGLERLLRLNMDDSASSTVGSIVSPSEYSGQSRVSEAGSVASTPHGGPSFFEARSIPSTPNQPPLHDAMESYFAQPAPPASTEAVVSEKGDRRRVKARDDRAQSHQREVVELAQSDERRHSLLHSFGADFRASFNTLPEPSHPRGVTPAVMSHSRNNSLTDVFDMPPPSERLLRLIIDSLPVQIFTAAPDTGAVTWVNSKFLAYSGKTPRQVLDNPWNAIHQDDRKVYLAGWEQSLRTGHHFEQKFRLKRFDASYRWYFARAAPLRDKNQNIVHWIVSYMDFHDTYTFEQTAAQQRQTAASEAKYRALAESSPQIVFSATRTKGITFCNSKWVSYSGQNEEQTAGVGFMDNVHPDDLVKCKLPLFEEDGSTNVPLSIPTRLRSADSSTNVSEAASDETNVTITGVSSPSPTSMQLPQRKLSELASTGILRVSTDDAGNTSYATEVRLRMKSGDYRWHLVRVILSKPDMTNEAGKEIFYGTATDIQDHKELEQSLKDTMDAKARFLANMSHEIRTPLNGIFGMANFLIDSSLTQEQMDQVNIIRASAEGLRSLINDILDLSKAEAGMIQLNMDWMHIRSVLEEVNDLTSTLAIDKGIGLNYLVDDEVPLVLKGDRFRIRQVLLNVIGNAIKFTQEGEVFTRCRVSQHTSEVLHDGGLLRKTQLRRDLLLEFDVIDTGPGFTTQQAEKLFKRFSQLDTSSTRQHGGSGLGLVISMQLVELHGGTMSARSTPGKGSTFTFSVLLGTVDKDAPVLSGVSPLAADASLATSPNQTPSVSSTILDRVISESPGPYAPQPPVAGRPSSLLSSENSNPSIYTLASDVSSSKTSMSSPGSIGPASPMGVLGNSRAQSYMASGGPYTILIFSPLEWTRMATAKHVQTSIPEGITYTVTQIGGTADLNDILRAENARFTHVFLAIPNSDDLAVAIEQLFTLSSRSTASVVVISDATQKKDVLSRDSAISLEALMRANRLQFIFKPLKPSKLSAIFDYRTTRGLSTDFNQSSAQESAAIQKQVLDEMGRRLGNKGSRVLLVEDNKINQMVMLKLLRRVSIEVDTVGDGLLCTDKVFAKGPGYYSIILCDLHMPNKDGYQTCKDIRAWERENNYKHIPMVALSANVLGDVYAKCVNAGFNSYLTKPVEFKELSDVMTVFLDPKDPSKPIEFMSHRPA